MPGMRFKLFENYYWPFVILVGALVLWPYWWVKPYEATGDGAFTWYFHEIFARGLTFGEDALITAGPWSLLYNHWYHPETFGIMLTLQCIIAVFTTSAITIVLMESSLPRLIQFVFAVAILAVLSLSIDARYIVHLFLLPLLFDRLQPGRFSLFFTMYLISAALVGLSKGTFALILLATILLLVVLELQSRRLPYYASILVGSVILWGIAANHFPTDLIAYFGSIFSVSNFYGQIFSEYGSFLQYLLYLFLTLAFGLLIVVTEGISRRGLPALLLITGCYGLVLLVVLKTGFMRQDGQHVIRAVFSLFSMLVLYSAFNYDKYHKYLNKFIKRKTINATIYVLIIIVSISSIVVLAKFPTVYGGKLERVVQQFRGMTDVVFQGGSNTASRLNDAVGRIQTRFPISVDYGVADLHVNGIVPAAFANLSEFDVVPGVTGYMAASARIDTANDQFVRQSQKNRFVFQHNSLAPASATILAFRELFEPITPYSDAGYMILGRRDFAERHVLTCTDWQSANWGERISTHQVGAAFTYLRLKYHRTLADALINGIYKPVPVYLEQFVDGELANQIPIEQAMALKGFIASPVLKRNQAMLGFLEGKLTDDGEATEVSIVVGGREDPLHGNIEPWYLVRPELSYQLCAGRFVPSASKSG